MAGPGTFGAKTTVIAEERPGDLPAIRQVNLAAFGQTDEADLVDALRADGDMIFSLAAREEDRIVGHLLMSRLPIITPSRRLKGAALAPVAVLPAYQKKGIGSKLITTSIAMCRERDLDLIVLVGHPSYYPRFGFEAKLARSLKAPFSGEAFMALMLRGKLAEGEIGTVHYARAFGLEGDGA